MGNRGDKVVFQLLRGAQLPGHVVDGVAQAADLVVLGLVDAHREIALGDLPGALAQLPHRHQDGTDEVYHDTEYNYSFSFCCTYLFLYPEGRRLYPGAFIVGNRIFYWRNDSFVYYFLS